MDVSSFDKQTKNPKKPISRILPSLQGSGGWGALSSHLSPILIAVHFIAFVFFLSRCHRHCHCHHHHVMYRGNLVSSLPISPKTKMATPNTSPAAPAPIAATPASAVPAAAGGGASAGGAAAPAGAPSASATPATIGAAANTSLYVGELSPDVTEVSQISRSSRYSRL